MDNVGKYSIKCSFILVPPCFFPHVVRSLYFPLPRWMSGAIESGFEHLNLL